MSELKINTLLETIEDKFYLGLMGKPIFTKTEVKLIFCTAVNDALTEMLENINFEEEYEQ